MSGVLSNAVSGLQASQNALRTAGHNIANANTEGYNRQRVNDVARPAERYGNAGYLGTGVTTQSIERVVDQFVNRQLRMDTTAFNQLDKYNTNIGKIDKLLANESTGLSAGLQRFFSAVQNGADDPSSTPGRQLVLTEAASLANRFNTLHDRFIEIGQSVEGEISVITQTINSLAKNVAELNQAIGNKSMSSGSEPNDLLDQRDQILSELSELISIETLQQSDGSMSVFVGKGQALVQGQNANRFEVRDGSQIFLAGGSRTPNITEQLNGGQLGGLLNFDRDVLQPSMNDLGRIGIILADQFNTQQRQGLDLDGDYGQLMFGDINEPELMAERVVQSRNNAGPDDRDMALAIVDTGQLTSSDYQVKIIENSNNYVITRLDDDTVVQQGVLTGAYPTSIEFDGLSLQLQGGSFQGGDEFTLKPTVNGARDMAALLSRPEDLAFAAPLRTATDPGNFGTGVVSQGQVLSLVDGNGDRLPAFASSGELSPPILVRFTSATTYDVLDNSDPGNPVPMEPPLREQTFVPGRDNALFSSDPGETRVMGEGARVGLPDGRTAADGILGFAAQSNGYPAEQLTFRRPNPDTGEIEQQAVITRANASAAQTAERLSSVPGVSANAFTSATLTDINIDSFASPLQITLNGENLLEYEAGVLSNKVPNPQTDESAFNDYLAERINQNDNLAALGFRAESGGNPITGAPELRLVASSGVDMDVRLEADNTGTNQLSVNDSNGNPNVRLEGGGAGFQAQVTVGGRVDITMAEGITLQTAPDDSQLFGDSSAADFARSSYLGYQVSIKGQPQAGDNFSVEFNTDASNDNRNALAMADLATGKTIGQGKFSFADAYGRLVEDVGTKSSSSRSNTQAAKSLMEQTQALRDSVSGVNLDEEAANLIKYEQVYNANSRVISVARDLFDTLLNAV